MSGVLSIFEQTGAYLKGHFRLTSGLHSDEYLQCALVLQHPAIAEQFGRELAAQLGGGEKAVTQAVDIVMSPAIGGLIIGHEVARALSGRENAQGMNARFIFTERDAGKMTLRRGFSLQQGERVVIVEDVITTGGSTREVIDLARAAGAEVLGAGSIIDRSGGAVDLGVPRIALATLQVRTWKPEECPLCQQGLPVVKPGSRAV